MEVINIRSISWFVSFIMENTRGYSHGDDDDDDESVSAAFR